MNVFITLVFFIIAITLSSFAQEPQRSTPADSLTRQNSASILFERNLNTFNWIANVNVDTVSLGTRLRINELFRSDIILIEATNSTREQRLQSNRQALLLRVNRQLAENLSAQARWSSLIYSDEKAVGLSTASENEILGGIEYLPNEHLVFSPMAGHRWDNQIGFRDRGLSYELSARTNSLTVDGYMIDGAAQFHQDRVNPRLLEQHFVRIGTQKYFLGNTRDSMQVGLRKNRREFYSFASGAIESRVENIFSFANLLDYEFDQRFLASLFVNVFSRGLDKTEIRTTSIDEFHLDAYAEAKYRDEDSGVEVSTRLGHSEQSERHLLKSRGLQNQNQLEQQEQSKDNLARQTSLSGRFVFPLSHSDRVAFSGATSILRYDTPSEINDDDRDELLVELSLSTYHNVSRFLDVSFSLSGTLSHLVYLFSERSTNNSINRILRFLPRTAFQPFASLTSINSFEVLANYTVYDFEQTTAQTQSFSYRQFGWIDSTSLEITNRLGLDFFVYWKVYERGQLRWSDFTERRENSFVDKTYAVQARFSPGDGSIIAVGIRYFSQSRYSYIGTDRRLDSFLRSFGPTCLLAWQLSKFSEIGLKGWYEVRKVEGGGTKSLANMTMNINIHL